jgi:hypothetical protein
MTKIEILPELIMRVSEEFGVTHEQAGRAIQEWMSHTVDSYICSIMERKMNEPEDA